ncbi:phytoene/squalene synthase family protein [Sphingorhabdus sp. Alg239-R122]|uniref:phytoene/squalene synthase family protein n=1 Tax=Sphingorhabdus sp. Alg239-R122 TaxID=2305989 RepID=UPI0013DA7332|nr:phytoene/squalene synthase family protein [Sphingorhabdus sp. Alg239-R122]
MAMTRADIVAHARDSIAKGSRSFALASKLFDSETREHAWLLYAWCRRCDDLADGQDMGHGMSHVDDPEARLEEIRYETQRTLSGDSCKDPAFSALGIVASECNLPRRYIDDVIEGFALDARDWRPRTEHDLYQYCYHVAGAVGRLMAIIMGVPPQDTKTLDRATDLGLAFQLANIARDLEEDDAAGRCYLPEEWLAEMDMPPGQHMKPPFRDRLVLLAQRLCDNAELYEASARVGAARLPFRSRWAVLAAAGIYGDIAREVRTRGGAAWDHRTVTSKASKIGWVVKAFMQAQQKPSNISREMLWTYDDARG